MLYSQNEHEYIDWDQSIQIDYMLRYICLFHLISPVNYIVVKISYHHRTVFIILQTNNQLMAETIQHYESDLNKYIDEFEDEVTQSPYEFSNRDKWINDCNKKIGTIKDLVYRYKYQLNELPRQQNTIFAASLKTLQSRFNKALETFNSKKGQKKAGGNNLYDDRDEEVPMDQMNVQQLMDHGTNMQNKMVSIINDMGMTLEQGLLLADEINLKLEGQIEQLNRMTETVKDTGSTLKKAQKHISYFKKALQCDKWLAGLLFLNLIALVALIVLIVKKVKK